MSAAADPYGDGLPILLGYQSRWNAEQAPVAVCEKSRRIGLSWGDAAERVIHAGEGAGNVTYASYSRDMTSTYIKDCAAWAKRFDRACSEVMEETVIEDDRKVHIYRIVFASGKEITALTSAARALRSIGKPGDVAVIDEAAFLNDLKAVLKAVVAVVMWGGKVRIISTHNGVGNDFAGLVNDIRAGRLPYAVHRITLDDAIAEGLARRICAVKGDAWHDRYALEWRGEVVASYGEDADEELHCIPAEGEGTWLAGTLIESRMRDAPTFRFDGTAEFNAAEENARRREMQAWLDGEVGPALKALDPLRRHVFGMDFARSSDLSALWPMEIGGTLTRTVPFGVEMRNVPHTNQLQAVTYVCDRLPRFGGGAMDASGNGSYVAEETHYRYGSIIDRVMPSEAWYRERMPRYKAAFEDGRIWIPRSDDVLSDHRAVKVVRGVPRLPQGKTDDKAERHGDTAIAGALAWTASESDAGPIEFESAGSRRLESAEGWLDGGGHPGRGLFSGWL